MRRDAVERGGRRSVIAEGSITPMQLPSSMAFPIVILQFALQFDEEEKKKKKEEERLTIEEEEEEGSD